MAEVRIGVVGATGAVGGVTLELLAERGFDNVRALASARSAGKPVRFGDRELVVEEATPAGALGRRPRPVLLLGRHRDEPGARPARRRRRRGRHRQVGRLSPHERDPAGRRRGERGHPERRLDRRQPELLRDAAHVRSQAARERGRTRASPARDVSVDVGRGRRRNREAEGARPAESRPRDGLGPR